MATFQATRERIRTLYEGDSVASRRLNPHCHYCENDVPLNSGIVKVRLICRPKAGALSNSWRSSLPHVVDHFQTGTCSDILRGILCLIVFNNGRNKSAENGVFPDTQGVRQCA